MKKIKVFTHQTRHFARMKKNVFRDAPVEEQQVIAAQPKGSSPFVREAAVKYLTRQTSFIKLWREIRYVNYAANVLMFYETVERLPSLVSKVTSATFSFFLENHCDLRRPPVENVPSLVRLVGTKKVGFLTRPTIRCKDLFPNQACRPA